MRFTFLIPEGHPAAAVPTHALFFTDDQFNRAREAVFPSFDPWKLLHYSSHEVSGDERAKLLEETGLPFDVIARLSHY